MSRHALREHEPAHPSPDLDGHARTVAHEVIGSVIRRLDIEPEWSRRTDDSLTWWGHRLRQDVTLETLTWAEGLVGVRALVRTEVASCIAPDDHLWTVMATLNQGAGIASFTWSDRTGRLGLGSTCYIFDTRAERHAGLSLLTLVCAGQLAEAEAIADLGEMEPYRFRLRLLGHPRRGPRRHPHPALSIYADLMEDGPVPAEVTRRDLERAAAKASHPSCPAAATAAGLSAEVPFLGDEEAGAADPAPLPPDTALVRLEPDWSSRCGEGMAASLELPVAPLDPPTANHMNCSELNRWTGVDHLGSWRADGFGPTFRTFIPSRHSSAYNPTTLLRAAGFRSVLWSGHVTDRTIAFDETEPRHPS